jgi:hypothetical protein
MPGPVALVALVELPPPPVGDDDDPPVLKHPAITINTSDNKADTPICFFTGSSQRADLFHCFL